MTTDQAKRRRYTDEDKAAIAAALASGKSQRQVALDLNVPSGTVATVQAAARSVMIVQDYSDIVMAQAKKYAAQSWEALDAHLRILADETYIREHPGEAFGLASAQRVLAESLARILQFI